MIYVADTHAFVLWLSDRRIGRDATRVFERAAQGIDGIILPTIALFEIASLIERGKFQPPLPWRHWLQALGNTPGLTVEPLHLEDVSIAHGLANLIDPFDRMIAATALRFECPLLTMDERIASSRVVPVVW